ncbi:ankyrin repeat domain-containing protein [Asanoa sp. WMMD1127]|uniref:ankyrin repeat domain-containing protein n=1 Tax=Asanoa sp. WMMD1127 TaxID=3016107 RepID=UPI002416A1CF|nr:ankyrin repeat domain-containing protein [Asanoa sp. WMMD1127]MDG4826692.1 ankyrin repeat domain-containing protein [Asanoa sp. WMMD1127]
MALTAAHEAVEEGDVRTLLELLRSGVNIHEEDHGYTLLHASVDAEISKHVHGGLPLHVDTTALLLAMGADPVRRSSGGAGVSAEHQAFVEGHWLALVLFEAWKKDRGVA